MGTQELTSPFRVLQLLQDKSINDVSTHRRAEALLEIAQIFRVSAHKCFGPRGAADNPKEELWLFSLSVVFS